MFKTLYLGCLLFFAAFSLQAEPIEAPETSYGGNYQVSWNHSSNPNSGFTLYEKYNNTAWEKVTGGSVVNGRNIIHFTGKVAGKYTYKLESCGGHPSYGYSCSDLPQDTQRTVEVYPPVPGSVNEVTVDLETIEVSGSNTDTDGKFSINWAKVAQSPSVNGYEVRQRYRAESGNWGSWYPSNGYRTTALNVRAESLHASSVLPDGIYQHQVRAYNEVNGYTSRGDWKNSAMVTVRNKPRAVTGLSSSVPEPTSTFYMTWNAVSNASQHEELSYQLQCKEPNDSYFGFDTCGDDSLNGTTTSKQISLPQGTSGIYKFQVRACNGLVPAGCGNWSSPATTVHVDIPIPVPHKPVWSTPPNDRSYGQIAMGWELPTSSPNGASYILQQQCMGGSDSCGKEGWHNLIPDEENPRDGKYSAQVQLGDQYKYRVKACNSVGQCSTWLSSEWVKVHALEGIGEVLDTDTNTVPGVIPFDVDVTNTGDASISIPIAAAPGVNGLEPGISLRYSGLRYHHRSKDQLPEDILGYGWRLGGFSEIRRCITGLDHSVVEVSLDDSDRLCLDGEPLVAVNGEYWQKETQYRTLRDSSRLITQKEGQEGRWWFEVKGPNGKVHEYGREPESRLRVGRSVDYGWSLNKVTDAFSNSIEYRYHLDLAEGVNYPLEIIYGNDGDASIQFEYSLRTDAPPQPMSEDIGQKQLVLLYRILVRLNDKDLREYRLISEDEGQVDGYRRLKEVQVCGYTKQGNPQQCLEPIKIDWEERDIGDYEFGIDFETGVKRITSSLKAKTEISYRTLSPDDSSGFIQQGPFGTEDDASLPGAYQLAPSYPDPQEPDRAVYRLVVSEIRRSTGLTLDWHKTQYRYQGTGLMSAKNWGFLGFHAQKIYDEKSGVSTYRQFRQDFPFAGTTARLLQCYGDCVSGEVLTENRYRYGLLDLGKGVVHTYLDQSLEAQLESGKLLGYREKRTVLGTENIDDDIGHVVQQRTVTERVVDAASIDDSSPAYWGDVATATISSANVLRSRRAVTKFANSISPWLIGFSEYQDVAHYDGDTVIQPDGRQTILSARWPGTNKLGSVVFYPGDDLYELQTDYSYDSVGNLESETVSGIEVQSRTTKVIEFLDGRYPTRIENPLKQEINVGYDERFGKADSVTDANGRVMEITYDAFGREDERTSVDGVLFKSDYFACSGCASIKGISPRYKLVTNSDITPQVTRFYDEWDRLLREEWQGFDGSLVRRDYGYDDQGRLEYQTEPYPSTASNPPFTKIDTFDNRDRVRALTTPQGASVTTAYSVESGRVKVRTEERVLDENGALAETQVREHFYLVTGDLDEVVDAKGATEEVSTNYTYYGSGQLRTVTVIGDTENFVSSFTYDHAGYRTQLTDPNLGSVKSVYNALGQLINQTDNKGQAVDYHYDKLGRLRFQVDGDGVSEWTYDPTNGIGLIGGRRYVEGGLWQNDVITGGTEVFKETYTYNGKSQLQRLTSELQAAGLSRSYQHNYDYYGTGDGRLKSITYPNGAGVTYDYGSDQRGYLHELRDHNEVPIKTFNQINARGQVEEEVYGNGLITSRSYDSKSGRLTNINTGGGSIQNNDYGWRSNGTLESRFIKNASGAQQQTETFTYDSLNRLTDSDILLADGVTRALGATYDNLGNILSKTSSHQGDAQVTGYQYGQTQNAGTNAVSNVDINGVAHTLHYDKNGAITRYDAASGDDKWITWNARQLPTEIVLADSQSSSTPTARDRFQYGPNGSRYYRETSWWDEGAQLMRTERAFILGNFEEQLPANDPDYERIEKTRLDSNVLHIAAYRHAGGEEEFTEYLHRDHLGSIEKVTDESGNLILDTAFEPFGARRNIEWSAELTKAELDALFQAQGISTRRGFTGHEHLDRTGLIHMNGRVFDPTLGRFLSPDPIVQFPQNSQSWNRYSYVRNNPVSVSDPTGFMEEVSVLGVNNNSNIGVGYYYPSVVPDLSAFSFYPGGAGGSETDADGGTPGAKERNTEKAKGQADRNCGVEYECVGVTASNWEMSENGNTIIIDGQEYEVAWGIGPPLNPTALRALFTKQFWKRMIGKEFPVKKGAGGKPQPYDPKTGQYLSAEANPGAAMSPIGRFTNGFSQGFAEGSATGVTGATPVGRAGDVGYALGNLIGTIGGWF
ncbi:RHS repeat-associated core domain-containing protein [Microbulbifer elongatus]|uniref:RHS repeat-associated core domain-containing protein n=1 Tax=Microbulbifer elongatus TaxID=86173 RepID=UPI001E3D5614|nr:RHS repeat-associated core domain-containing protein [Microbulbifer elongatus]